jgi:hypothetical protein
MPDDKEESLREEFYRAFDPLYGIYRLSKITPDVSERMLAGQVMAESWFTSLAEFDNVFRQRERSDEL